MGRELEAKAEAKAQPEVAKPENAAPPPRQNALSGVMSGVFGRSRKQPIGIQASNPNPEPEEEVPELSPDEDRGCPRSFSSVCHDKYDNFCPGCACCADCSRCTSGEHYK